MKTYSQLLEDIEARRRKAHQHRKNQMTSHRERVAAYVQNAQQQRENQRERERLKSEIKRELQAEQSPGMHLTPFNIMKAREQARGGVAHRRHVHGELAREADKQETAKNQRIRAILNHE